MVMTEEILDDWEAQTLNIPFEKLVRHKKTLKNVIIIHTLITGIVGRIRETKKRGEDQANFNAAINKQI